jgi:putative PIN family toxin of toxin-antitoxin system
VKVFLDTNVLVSAFATRGLCADLFCHLLLEHEIVTGELVLTELRRVLREKLRVPPAMLQDIETILREHEVVPKPRRHLGVGLADRDDEWIVASAVAGHAELLVTGDAALLKLGNRSPVAVVSPRGMWERLRG